MSTPRILVEGGPVDIRSKRVLAAFVGLMIGAGSVLGWVAFEAFHASSDIHTAIEQVKRSRLEAAMRTCTESDKHHATAKAGIELLLRQTTPHNHALKEGAQQHYLLEEFVTAIAPYYDCKVRVKELMRP